MVRRTPGDWQSYTASSLLLYTTRRTHQKEITDRDQRGKPALDLPGDNTRGPGVAPAPRGLVWRSVAILESEILRNRGTAPEYGSTKAGTRALFAPWDGWFVKVACLFRVGTLTTLVTCVILNAKTGEGILLCTVVVCPGSVIFLAFVSCFYLFWELVSCTGDVRA